MTNKNSKIKPLVPKSYILTPTQIKESLSPSMRDINLSINNPQPPASASFNSNRVLAGQQSERIQKLKIGLRNNRYVLKKGQELKLTDENNLQLHSSENQDTVVTQ
mmetsp:Transcript_21084/g.20241  ORF Transcript_21084/g.20241 Transcript_21084/m.20241 type:complete len:106 (+) Transcript_21084:111-428(+)